VVHRRLDMTQRRHTMLLLAAASFFVLVACDKKDEKADGGEGDKKAEEDKPSLMLTNDTPACRAALECCEAQVTAEKGKATPEDINLSCSGVGMAENDDTCNQFKTGYAQAIEGMGKPVPDVCK
jgi:hypothetical protein